MLTDYRLACLPSDVDLSHVHTGASGEYNQKEAREAVHASSRIVGDVVGTYLKYAAGKLGLTFAVDIESAEELAAAYRAKGVPSEIITGETPIHVRSAFLQQFRERRILQLVSVDVLGEGTDVPAVEVVSMARPTNSFQLFAQQCGRALRLNVDPRYAAHWNSYTDDERLRIIAASGKPRALIIDHVQNALRHGLPDVEREYSLNRREKASRGVKATDPLRSCSACLQPYEKELTQCPYCGKPWEPGARGCPEAVEGDIVLLDDFVLAQWRQAIAKVDGVCNYPAAAPAEASASILRRHLDRQQAQQTLRSAMALYGGLMEHQGHETRVGHKKFFRQFGLDILTAQTLGTREAGELEARIRSYLDSLNVVEVKI